MRQLVKDAKTTDSKPGSKGNKPKPRPKGNKEKGKQNKQKTTPKDNSSKRKPKKVKSPPKTTETADGEKAKPPKRRRQKAEAWEWEVSVFQMVYIIWHDDKLIRKRKIYIYTTLLQEMRPIQIRRSFSISFYIRLHVYNICPVVPWRDHSHKMFVWRW